jgi:hypothetical protein
MVDEKSYFFGFGHRAFTLFRPSAKPIAANLVLATGDPFPGPSDSGGFSV